VFSQIKCSALSPAGVQDPHLPLPVQRTAYRLPPGLIRASIAAIAILISVWAQYLAPPAVSFFGNEWLRDTFIKLQVRDSREPRVLVVDIDESSTASLGPWPWPRERLATLAEILLTHYGAKGVALDIVLPDARDSAGDQRLALMARHGPLVLAQAFDFQRTRPLPLRDGVLSDPDRAYPPGGVQATGYIGNHEGLGGATKAGSIGLLPDADGVIRRVPLVTSFEGRQYPALQLALLNCCSGAAPLSAPPPGLMRIPFTRDWTAFDVVTAAEIMGHEMDVGSIGGRLVIIGSSSLGLGDRVATPISGDRPGLGVQAGILSALLDIQQGKAPAPWPGKLLALLFAVGAALLASFAFPRLQALHCVALLGAASLAWLALAYFASRHDPDFVASAPLATNLFLLAVAVPYQWQLAQHKSRHLLDTLRQYVAPEVVDELLKSDLADPLKPRELDVTTLIADMEGYTTQVESLSVEDAATLTRDFLDCLTGPVIDKHGTLDKYTGDGLVAFWGAPLPIAQHADLALDAAREIVRRVERLSRERGRDGHPALRVRIGIESGLAMAGDFGTSFRSIYTAVGDSVNTASRLEQAARDFPHDIIVGAGTVERARRHRFLPLGERQLRGKEKTTTLFTINNNMQAAEDTEAHCSPAPPGEPAETA
jgi:adenylate cyclase